MRAIAGAVWNLLVNVTVFVLMVGALVRITRFLFLSVFHKP